MGLPVFAGKGTQKPSSLNFESPIKVNPNPNAPNPIIQVPRTPTTGGVGVWSKPAPTPAPTPAPVVRDPNLDLNGPGYAENFWNENSGFAGEDHTAQAGDAFASMFTSPTDTESFWDQTQADPGSFGNRTAEEYNKFDSSGPDFGSYYDNAYTRGSNAINKDLGARGQYGSSQGTRALTDLATGVNAERASRESDFDAQRQRDRIQTANLADTTDRLNTQTKSTLADMSTDAGFQRAQGGLSFGSAMDANERADFSTGLGGAATAQGAREGRIRGGYDDLLKAGEDTSGLVSDQFDKLLGTDNAQFEHYLEYELGIPREVLNQVLARRNENTNSVGTALSIYGAVMGGGGGGGGVSGKNVLASTPGNTTGGAGTSPNSTYNLSGAGLG